MDIETLYLVLISAQLGMALVLAWMIPAHGSELALRYWAAGGVASALGALGFMLQAQAHPFFSVVLANAMILTGMLCNWQGVRAYFGRGVHWPIIATLLLLQLGITSYFAATPSALWLRIVCTSLTCMVAACGVLYELGSNKNSMLYRSCRILFVIHIIYIMTFLVRVIITLITRPEGVYLDTAGAFSAPIIFFSIVCAFLCTMGYVLMLSEKLQWALNEQAIKDGLTGLKNRRAFQEESQRDVQQAAQAQQHVALLLFDLDRFKSLNDRFGHHIGDLVLQRFAATVDRTLDAQHLFARMGGEEFAVLLRACDLTQAMRIAQSARTQVEAMGLEINGEPVHTTVSIGCTVILQGDTLDRALGRADRALYRAKSNGRNRVEVELNQDADPVFIDWSPALTPQI